MRSAATAVRAVDMPRGSPTTQIALRLPPELLEQADALAEPLSPPGLSYSRADVLRMAIAEGLAVLHAKARPASKRSK
jgi:hypothetical protein